MTRVTTSGKFIAKIQIKHQSLWCSTCDHHPGNIHATVTLNGTSWLQHKWGPKHNSCWLLHFCHNDSHVSQKLFSIACTGCPLVCVDRSSQPLNSSTRDSMFWPFIECILHCVESSKVQHSGLWQLCKRCLFILGFGFNNTWVTCHTLSLRANQHCC